MAGYRKGVSSSIECSWLRPAHAIAVAVSSLFSSGYQCTIVASYHIHPFSIVLEEACSDHHEGPKARASGVWLSGLIVVFKLVFPRTEAN